MPLPAATFSVSGGVLVFVIANLVSSRLAYVSSSSASRVKGWDSPAPDSPVIFAHAGGRSALLCSRINVFRRFSLLTQRDCSHCPSSLWKSSGSYTPSSHCDSRFIFANFKRLVLISSVRECSSTALDVRYWHQFPMATSVSCVILLSTARIDTHEKVRSHYFRFVLLLREELLFGRE